MKFCATLDYILDPKNGQTLNQDLNSGVTRGNRVH